MLQYTPSVSEYRTKHTTYCNVLHFDPVLERKSERKREREPAISFYSGVKRKI